jgi:peptide-methionine (R)-S-oxide reductase
MSIQPLRASVSDQQQLPETEAQWRERLTDDEYHVLREAGTEPRNTSELLHVDEDGTFHCAGCGQTLFESDAKFESGTGWPSFFEPATEDAVDTQPDDGLLGTRTEVLCSECGGHLGHVFEDGPQPTGLRYCMNGRALGFDSED